MPCPEQSTENTGGIAGLKKPRRERWEMLWEREEKIEERKWGEIGSKEVSLSAFAILRLSPPSTFPLRSISL